MDLVRPLKIENPSSGGVETDPFPTEINPLEDLVSSKGLAFEGSTLSTISGNSSRIDLDSPTTEIKQLAKLRNYQFDPEFTTTSASTKALTVNSKTLQLFTGSTSGQIVTLPSALTVAEGYFYEIWNFSTQTVSVRDFGGTVLATLRANARTQILCRDATTANGQWALTYTLDNGNAFGTQLYYAEDNTETSTSSTTTFSTKLTLATPSTLPLGDYLLKFQFIWRSSSANREADFRFQLNGSTVQQWQPSTGRTQDRQLLSGFVRSQNLSGVNTWTFQFKVFATATTIFTSTAKMLVWRIA